VTAAPAAVVTNTVTTALGSTLQWSLWDRLEVDGTTAAAAAAAAMATGGAAADRAAEQVCCCTLREFLDRFKATQGLEVGIISYGRSMLYAEWMGKKMEARMGWSMVQLVETVAKTVLPADQTHLALSVSCTDPNDDDVEVPTVNLRIRPHPHRAAAGA
jgi:hypothetical protein